ncbi:hypothetical protein Q7C18_02790 [Nesterenkonia sp. CL21]|uniref:hypothetical protein n=1 Tax=Nesterenkonia sp. CL21 TaxID=3064894 RepID=UPI002879B4E8|nr:hypothetical protein [Nesterenkonia sp. CL21]MDS2171616.1 hypothetical protein [Nesterenkonia sp. CL21]
MPETVEGQEPGNEQAPNAEEAQAGQATEATEEVNGGSPLWEGIAEDHPVRAEVEKLRKEAAAKRTTAQQIKQENDDLKAKLAEAKTSEEVQELINDYEAKVHTLEVENLKANVAAEYKLPKDLAALLQGSDKESLEAHAETLSQYAPKGATPPPAPPSGGRVPADKPKSIEDMKAAVRKHYRR